MRQKYRYIGREKGRYIPKNWPEPTREALELFNAHVKEADYLARKYCGIYYFPGYSLDDIRQEVLLTIYKSALFFKPERKIKFKSYIAMSVRNMLVNIIRDQQARINEVHGLDNLESLDFGEDTPVLSKKYIGLEEENIYDDEKELMGQEIGKLSETDLNNLKTLCGGNNVVGVAAVNGTSKSYVYNYYHKIGRVLEQAFIDAGLASDFKQIVTYLLDYYAPIVNFEGQELEIPKPPKEAKSRYKATKTEFKVISPSGELLTGTNQRQFCREYSLCSRAFNKLLLGKCSHYRGFRVYKEGMELTPFVEIRKGKEFTVIAPDGQILREHNIVRFAEIHNLGRSSLSMLLRGKIKCHKGYTMIPNALTELIDELLQTHPE